MPTRSTGAVKPSISIAMATFNGASFLIDQLRSFENQSRPPDELIICDDASNDATPQILADFVDRATFPVAVYRNHRQTGPAATFNRAIGLCTGDLILLSDQDDVWLSSKVESIEALFLDNPSTLVAIHDLSLVDSTLQDAGTTQLKRLRQMRMPDAMHVTGCATAFRSDLLPIILPIPQTIRTYDAWIHVIGRALGAREVVEEVLALYRRHAATDTEAIAASWSVRGLLSAARSSLSAPSDIVNGERFAWLDELDHRLDNLPEADWEVLAGIGREKAKAFVVSQRQAVEERLQVLETPRLLRIPKILRAMRAGLYAQFSGPGSALRDLLAPRGISGPRGPTSGAESGDNNANRAL